MLNSAENGKITINHILTYGVHDRMSVTAKNIENIFKVHSVLLGCRKDFGND